MKIHRPMGVLAVLILCMTAPGLSAAQSSQGSGDKMRQTESTVSGLKDFDFLIGRWQVHHRRLKERLANNHEWIEFEGTSVVQKLMDGYGTVDDNVLQLPAGTYRGVGLRSFEPKSGQWSIW